MNIKIPISEAKEISKLIYEVVIYAETQNKFWVTSRENYFIMQGEKCHENSYPFNAEILKEELEKYGLKIHISDDKLRLSVEKLEGL